MTKTITRILLYSLIVASAIGLFMAYGVYSDIKLSNVKLNNDGELIQIPSGAVYADVKLLLSDYLIDLESFEWVAEKKNYPNAVKAGRYKIINGMSNNDLINLLRSGNQEVVRLVFNKVRTKDVFSGIIAKQIEADSISILNLLNDAEFLTSLEKNAETAMTLFVPNTYEFFWNTSASQFIKRMAKESSRVWNEKRLKKAEKLNLSPNEVFILASIVEEETIKGDELAKVAGVYINRLNRGMRLQADPTVRFALGDFEIKRILNRHLTIDSPYNTYKVNGLTPGPICLPSLKTIDAVLDYEKHKYLYFCAKADFSGYHAFAKNLIQHNKNAKAYQQALNKNRIYR